MNNRGFTLIEVLIALLIIAVVMLAVMKSLQSSIRNTTRLHDRLSAHWVAMNVLGELQAGVLPPLKEVDTEKGTLKQLGLKWRWVAGINQGGHTTYQRVYVDVLRDHHRVEHLLGFVRVPDAKN